jgi:hypothetical protein
MREKCYVTNERCRWTWRAAGTIFNVAKKVLTFKVGGLQEGRIKHAIPIVSSICPQIIESPRPVVFNLFCLRTQDEISLELLNSKIVGV